MVTKDNRSTRKTRTAIKAAMLALMQKNNYQLITVQEIIDHADICRTTFYAHFRDIYDLIDDIEDDFLSQFSSMLARLVGRPYIEGEHPIFTDLAGLMKQYGDIILILTGKYGDINFQRKLAERANEITRQIWMVRYGQNYDEEKYLLYSSFVVTGSLNMINTILEHKIDWSPEKIGNMIGEIVVAGERLFFPEPVL